MSVIERVRLELQTLGYEPKIEVFPRFNSGPIIAFDYYVKNGRHRGGTFKVGLSFQEDAYPEYPPHFVHIADLGPTDLTKHSSHQFNGTEWSVFSAPPSDFWDTLPQDAKNMETYVNRHLVRFWSEV